MQAKVFQSGNSQAVRIPKEFRLDVEVVEISKEGEVLLLKPLKSTKTLADAFNLLATMPEDFMQADREDDLPQEREW